jgi:hypothetical protein
MLFNASVYLYFPEVDTLSVWVYCRVCSLMEYFCVSRLNSDSAYTWKGRTRTVIFFLYFGIFKSYFEKWICPKLISKIWPFGVTLVWSVCQFEGVTLCALVWLRGLTRVRCTTLGELIGLAWLQWSDLRNKFWPSSFIEIWLKKANIQKKIKNSLNLQISIVKLQVVLPPDFIFRRWESCV